MSTVEVLINGQKTEVEKGTKLLELAKQHQHRYQSPIVLAKVNYSLKELHYELEEDSEVEFLDITNKDGYRTYQRSISLLLVKAVRDVLDPNMELDIKIHFSINSGFYIEFPMQGKPVEEVIELLKKQMNLMIEQDLPFEKIPMKVDQAREIFLQQNMLDKIQLFKYRRSSYVNLCRLGDYYDYFYGHMVPSTGCLTKYDIFPYEDGIILQFIDISNPKQVAHFSPDRKLFRTLKMTENWGSIMDVETVGDLNRIISNGQINELMLVSEALMEKRIAQIADKIINDPGEKKFVFIAGPSSSGKTTFANRLSIQLRAHGVKPYTISLDNYFVDREKTPLDENGNYDFECLEALDLEQFNKDMSLLLEGKTVDMPVFDFIKGKREYRGNFLTLEENGILVLEGIHGLNNKLSYMLPSDKKFFIYISALTTLNVDNHNRIPTTDARLIRRMVRDNLYRGASAIKTISMWDSVRRGEEKHIFPYQEQADVMFNSTLIYELAVLKPFVEPLLFGVPKECPEYIEARRLIKFLDYFLGVSSEKIPHNSLLREFIGGSCF